MLETDVHAFLEGLVAVAVAEIEPVEPAAEDTVRDAAAALVEEISDSEDLGRHLMSHLQFLGAAAREVITVVLKQVVLVA
jgi:hypothetical protein